MKNFIYIIAATVLFSACAFGQMVETAKPAETAAPVAASPAPAKEAAFPREKFDPARDPRADLDEAIKVAAKTGKNIVLDIGGEWCPWCVFMDKFFFQHPDLAKVRDANYVWVKVNYSKENKNQAFLSAYPERPGYPHLYVLDPSGKLLQSQDTSLLEMGKGYNPDKFAEFLNKWAPKPGMTDSAKSVQSPN
jgi:thiol:disulfide interchange protein